MCISCIHGRQKEKELIFRDGLEFRLEYYIQIKTKERGLGGLVMGMGT